MSLRHVGVLWWNEVVRGPKNFLFVFAIVVPVVISLVVSLLFGTFFSGKPRLGLSAAGDSQIVRRAADLDSIILTQYASAAELRQAVAGGMVDVGMALPADFDQRLRQGERAELTAYTWGESLLKNRIVLATIVIQLIRDVAGQELPVEIVTTALGETQNLPWEDRLLPFIVLITVLIGGTMVPATSLVDEKQKRTLRALTITPASLEAVFVAKGLLGALLSLAMGVLILAMNQAFGAQPVLLVVVLALGACLAATFGVLLGAFVKDINTLFATIKSIGIVLYAPALIYMFPQIPQWIGRLFPTYYMIQPVVEITQQGGSWAEVAPELVILLGLILALMAAVAVVARRTRRQEGWATA